MRKNSGALSPLDIINEINSEFDEGIIVTDVGQHQMLVTQYADITAKKQLVMSGGLGTMGYGLPGGIGAKIGNPDKPVIVVSGDGGMQMNIQEMATAVLEELPVIICIFNNEIPWHGTPVAETFLRKALRHDQLKGRRPLPPHQRRGISGIHPDFVKLAESYGAKGMRVTRKEEIHAAFEEAKKNTTTPTLIEFIISPEEMVYPMIKPGGTLEDMIMDC